MSSLIWDPPDPSLPGIIGTTYMGFVLSIKPCGSSEFDGFINGHQIWAAGSDDEEHVKETLIALVDKHVSEPEKQPWEHKLPTPIITIINTPLA